ncbi:MAG TPA: glyoxalase/bleomycin resistance/dioxygenase family protein [Phycisphaerales bacterium]|nr:glyoxalase/bleomycin resistance/dioxygenase family protein [Phycisphaerales bacterium]HCD33606.1 glyoxalase/bleomycin resistance/dioxygenase family protein [Phycisphaerales bacterium]|tara:strand:+ start:5184 stop:5567 length:384 start_codon:yes stop_codon:yes gene_type:complete
MRIEHFAVQVASPTEMTSWYQKHLGLRIIRHVGGIAGTCFLADDSDRVLLEIYSNPKVVTPDYASMHPLLLHMAFVSDDVQRDCDRLARAGATVIDAPFVSPAGDSLAMLRDPWGLAIQLCCRAKQM